MNLIRMVLVIATLGCSPASVRAQGASPGVLTGAAALGDWHGDRPGVRRRITIADLPRPYASRSAGNSPRVVPRPADAVPLAPPGFQVSLFAEGLSNPRILRVAPNGDVFVAETAAGRVRVLRAAPGAGQASANTVFARGLDAPFGIAFYPPGPDPHFVYVAETNRVLRFAYRAGDQVASGAPEVVVRQLSRESGGHSTRDLAFSLDGLRMFVSIGSASNVAEGMGSGRPEPRDDVLGAAWGYEAGRAVVLGFTPDGGNRRVFATGLRNCVGLAVQPGTGAVWCSTNERDGLGDDLPPDYVTRVREGGFYGWPWYYLGDHEDPRHRGGRPDLRGRIAVPDVLIQSHSASLGMAFHDGAAFAAEHGSWNRSKRTGYKVVRIPLDAAGAPTGEYEDFLTGFVIDDSRVWGRPVGVASAADGALLVSEDGNGTIWRVAPSR